MRALVIGGTGPTGPHIVEGLVERGFDVAIFHRGTHEVDGLPPIEHIHGDPHFAETISAGLGDRTFDIVVAAYGRLRLLAETLAGRCRQFIAIGGVAAYRGSMEPSECVPYGMPLPASEDSPTLELKADLERGSPGTRIRAAEVRVMELHAAGAFAATCLRYPSIYGPRQVAPSEWSVVRRVLDGRRSMILPDGGLVVYSRCAAINAAHAVLLAVDQPEAAAGRTYNCADSELMSLRQWAERIAALMGGRLEVVSLPWELATSAHGIARARSHVIVDTSRIRMELGYRDQVGFEEQMGLTIEWYLAHPVTREEYPWLTDPFDYPAEDRLEAEYAQTMSGLASLAGEALDFVHPYAHPRDANQAVDHRSR
jgi:nucleoside-diphosphate-sugar epimerase